MLCTSPSRSVLTTRGIECALWTWRSASASSKALVVVHHGLGGHAHFPTTRLAAESLSAAGFIVVAMDLPGHGESKGLRGYIESADALETDAVGPPRSLPALISPTPALASLQPRTLTSPGSGHTRCQGRSPWCPALLARAPLPVSVWCTVGALRALTRRRLYAAQGHHAGHVSKAQVAGWGPTLPSLGPCLASAPQALGVYAAP